MQHHTLVYPVTAPDGSVITRLTMRRPKVKDDMAAKSGTAGGAAETEAHLFAILTGVAPEVIGDLDLESDYAALSLLYRGYKGQRRVAPGAPIPLSYPVSLPPHPDLTELILRRPKVRDELEVHRLADGPAEVEMRLMALLTGVAPEVIAEMDLLDDYEVLRSAYLDFRRPPAIGAGGIPGTSGDGVSASPATA